MTIVELIDTVVYSAVRRKYGTRKQWLTCYHFQYYLGADRYRCFLLIAYTGLHDFFRCW